jgi:hypothetical protein
MFNPDAPLPPPTDEPLRQAQILDRKTNGFVTHAVWLPGNIWYLSLDAFADPGSRENNSASP